MLTRTVSVCPAQLTSETSSTPDGAQNAISTPAQPLQKRKRGRPRKIVPAQPLPEDEAICSKTMLPTPDVSTQSTLATDEVASQSSPEVGLRDVRKRLTIDSGSSRPVKRRRSKQGVLHSPLALSLSSNPRQVELPLSPLATDNASLSSAGEELSDVVDFELLDIPQFSSFPFVRMSRSAIASEYYEDKTFDKSIYLPPGMKYMVEGRLP